MNLIDKEHVYARAYDHWCEITGNGKSSLRNPLYNDHRKFTHWLKAEYGIQARLKNLVLDLTFPDAATETWFMLRYT
jgi:hypothetical protein